MAESRARRSPKTRRIGVLWREGLTTAQIAAEVGVEPNAVSQAVRHLRADGEDLPARRARPWTAGDDVELLEAVGRLGREAAAAHVGRTLAAVDSRLSAIEASGTRIPASAFSTGPRSWSEDADRDLIRGFQEGTTVRQLAERLGRAPHVVDARITQLRAAGVELTPRRPRWTPAERELLARRYREGATYVQLGQELGGRSKGTISRQLANLRAQGVDLHRGGKT